MIIPDNFGIAMLITLLAGLSTAIGGCIAFVVKPDNMRVFAVGLGFSAGVMIFLSFMDILPEAKEMLSVNYPNDFEWLVLAGFTAGLAIAALIDYFIPDHIDTQELFHKHKDKHLYCTHHHKQYDHSKFKRAGLFTAVAICVHNFPEGMATFLASTQNLTLGASVGLAIAIHNIPEGIAVALPIYNSTGKKRYAMLYSALSGLSEPLGALIGMFLFQLFLPQILVGFLFAAVAGIMIYISFDTLLPLARAHGSGHLSMAGIVSGMLFMWITTLFI
jgi:ZIP family zinc transporter